MIDRKGEGESEQASELERLIQPLSAYHYTQGSVDLRPVERRGEIAPEDNTGKGERQEAGGEASQE